MPVFAISGATSESPFPSKITADSSTSYEEKKRDEVLIVSQVVFDSVRVVLSSVKSCHLMI